MKFVCGTMFLSCSYPTKKFKHTLFLMLELFVLLLINFMHNYVQLFTYISQKHRHIMTIGYNFKQNLLRTFI